MLQKSLGSNFLALYIWEVDLPACLAEELLPLLQSSATDHQDLLQSHLVEIFRWFQEYAATVSRRRADEGFADAQRRGGTSHGVSRLTKADLKERKRF